MNEIKKKLSDVSEKKIQLANADPECVKDIISKSKEGVIGSSLTGQIEQQTNSNGENFVEILKKMKTNSDLIKVEIDREIMRLKEKFKLHEHENSEVDSMLCSICMDRKKNIGFFDNFFSSFLKNHWF